MIARGLEKPGKTKGGLARAMGVRPGAVSEILSGLRLIKASEIAPISGIIFSEVMEAAGTPKGVYNMVNGTGPDVGQIMAGHPDVDMVSFTGSTRAGIIVAKTAAETVKRVAQELGGKSANIILGDADIEKTVAAGMQSVVMNTGQSCNAPTRMLVPRALMARAAAAIGISSTAITTSLALIRASPASTVAASMSSLAPMSRMMKFSPLSLRMMMPTPVARSARAETSAASTPSAA